MADSNYQSRRSVVFDGPAAMKDLRLARFIAREQISRPFEYQLALLGGESGSDGAIDPDRILGQPVTVLLSPGAATPRHFNGIVTEFAHVGYGDRHHEYHAVLRPAFWLLTRRADCRIFQKKST